MNASHKITTRGYSLTTRANKTAFCPAGRGDSPRVAVVYDICAVEETEKPFGKRWHHEEIVLQAEHLAALREGKAVAVDVREEYVVFLQLDAKVAARLKELGYGG